MNVRLVVESGGKRKVLNLRDSEAVLGRAHGNTVRIPSAEVSRQHCRLVIDDGLVRLEDLDSVNGTFLNGTRIRRSEVVRPGDHLEVGPVTFVVEYELTPDALDRLREETGEQEDELEVLEALVQEADLEILAPDEVEDLPALEAIEGEELETIQPDVEELDAGGWLNNSEGGGWRDILSQLGNDD